MHHFHYRGGVLHAEDVSIARLAARPRLVHRSIATRRRRCPASPLELQRGLREVARRADLLCREGELRTGPVLRLWARARRRHRRRLRGGELRVPSRPAVIGERRSSSPASARPPEMRTPSSSDVFLFNVESEAELHTLARCRTSGGTAAQSRCASIPTCRPRRTPRPIPASRASSSASTSQHRARLPGGAPLPASRSSACTCTSARRS